MCIDTDTHTHVYIHRCIQIIKINLKEYESYAGGWGGVEGGEDELRMYFIREE